MKYYCILLALVGMSITGQAQLVAKMEVKEDIPGICDKNEVYALLPMMSGQVEAIAPLTKEQILEKLNAEVQYLKDNPKFKGKGMINVIINCKGELVWCKMDNSTKKDELDKQIENVFKTMTTWVVGTLDGKAVDSTQLFSFKIQKGKIIFD